MPSLMKFLYVGNDFAHFTCRNALDTVLLATVPFIGTISVTFALCKLE